MANPNPNTSGLTPFQPGQSGNPGGKTSDQRKLEVANAEAATRLRARMLKGLEAQLEAAEGDDAAVGLIEANILRLLTDSENRGLGTPVQSIQGPGEGGEFIHEIRRRIVRP